jgi:hypothetical protein
VGPGLALVLRELNEGGFAVEGAGPLPAGVEHAIRFSARRQEVVVRARSLHCVRISANGDAPKFVIWFGFPRQRPEDVHRIAQVTALMDARETT